jgi:hypothetical protein
MPHVIAKSTVSGQYVPLDHPEADPEIISGELRKVTMSNDDGHASGFAHGAVDYVPVEHVQQYAAEARTRWQSVTVGESHDSGPGGDDQHSQADDHPAVVRALGKVK